MPTKTSNTQQLGKELFSVLQAVSQLQGTSPIIPQGKLERALYGAKHWGEEKGIHIPTIGRELEFTQHGEKGLHCKGIEELLQGGIKQGSIKKLGKGDNYKLTEQQQTLRTLTYNPEELVGLATYIYCHVTQTKN